MHKSLTFLSVFGLGLVGIVSPPTASAVDLTSGLMTAVPVKDGRPPIIDGELNDWDLSAAEPVYVSKQAARQYNADWAIMYDDAALYIGATVSLPGRPLRNPAEPQDGFWWADVLQVRLATDPKLPYPLDANRDAKNERVAHLSLWRNHDTGREYLNVTRGAKLDQGQVNNPAGSEVRIVPHGTDFYVVEAKIPWSILNAAGGKNPYRAGERMTAILEALWIGGDSTRVAAVYNTNPATFAFMRPNAWGQVEFAAAGFGQRRRPTMDAILDELAKEAETVPTVGVPIEIDVPEDGLKLSVNIIDGDGRVIRELVGGQPVKRGKATVRWDGTDAFGHAMDIKTYRWSAYLSGGLKADYRGALGTAGDPPYQTFDGLGGWGGDHSLPIDVATDADAYYFLWPVAEAGKAIVKIDPQGKMLWRANPFVGGGFGPFYSVAVDDRHVYLAIGGEDVRLVRLDKKSGKLLLWDDQGTKELPLYKTQLKAADDINVPHNARHYKLPPLPDNQVGHPDACGMAIQDGRLYVTSYSRDKVVVFDLTSAKVTGEIAIAAPRGLDAGRDGNLYGVTYPSGGTGQIMRLDRTTNTFAPIITGGLAAPYDVAVGDDGTMYVSDLADAQQVKVFDPAGKRVREIGKAGGRPWQGKYDGDALLKPAGLSIDPKGQLLIAEAAIPKVFSRFDPVAGRINKRWFGPGVYWNHCWPMPEDPQQVFFTLNHGFGLAKPSEKEDERAPLYYWQPQKAGFGFVGDIENLIPSPETIRANNKELYFVRDSNPHLVMLLRDGVMRPVAQFTYRAPHIKEENSTGKPYMDVWIDADGDGQQQPAERSKLTHLADGSPLPLMANVVGSFHLEPNGDLYFVSVENRILKLPAGGFHGDALLKWDTRSMVVVVPQVLPGYDRLDTGFRQGILGVRIDGEKNFYTLFNARLSGKTGRAYDYPTEAAAKQQFEGMGHSSSFNAVKFAKYDAQGRLLWMAGRKATAGARPGEMFHFWNMAGLVNDRYVAGGSEWGQIYFYTHDGFFVDALMNNPAESPAPGPYTFGGETSGGRVAYFPQRDELWAYSSGMAYQVAGFKDGKVVGERRLQGNVTLDRVYTTEPATIVTAPQPPMTIVPMAGDPVKDEGLWNDVPATTVNLRGSDRRLATVQLGYDARFLYARLDVVDDTPLENGADNLQMAFKGGDTAGIVVGPGQHAQGGAGDVRLMVAAVNGKPTLIAMKARTTGPKKPAEYVTPASGTVTFDYVGEVPGGVVSVTKRPDGYRCTFAVPAGFLEFPLNPQTELRGDVEVRLSGAGARGLQTVSRHYLFTPSSPETTMVDDVPTESKMYPQFWGKMLCK